MQASTPEDKSLSPLRVVGFQATDRKSQIQHDADFPQLKSGEVNLREKMDTSETIVPRPPSPPQEMAKINLTLGAAPISQDVKAEASWTTPQKSTSSRTDRDSPLSQVGPRKTQQQLMPSDYEGDLLNQFVWLSLLLDSYSHHLIHRNNLYPPQYSLSSPSQRKKHVSSSNQHTCRRMNLRTNLL